IILRTGVYISYYLFEKLLSKLIMNNNSLVEIVEKKDTFLRYKSPRDKRVLEAMSRVDRANFLDSDPAILTTVDTDFANKLILFLKEWEDVKKSEKDPMDLLLYGTAMLLKSRRDYRVETRSLAYNDLAVPIGYNQTCSQPSLVAFMADILELGDNMKVLEIGTGCGYHAAISSLLIGDSGFLITMEYIKELAEKAKQNLANKFGQENLENRLKILHGDGSAGFEGEAPFDRIYLTAGINTDSFNFMVLAKQLRPEGGILLFPQERGDIIKQMYSNGKLENETRYDADVRFVPLKGQNS
ncbi:MAG: hypothetical protein AABX33_06000, partial [Nanoarchaeota archaeon]